MPDIVELQIVLLRPEERHRVEALMRAQHVAGSRLALPFGDDPVLDADRLAGQPVGPPGDIAGGPDAANACREIGIDGDASVNGDPGRLGERGPRPDPNPDDDEVGIEPFAVLQCDAVWIERGCRGTEVKRDAVILVDLADEISDFRTKKRASGATTDTASPRVRNDAATSRPIKLAPMTTTRRAAVAAAINARLSASVRK